MLRKTKVCDACKGAGKVKCRKCRCCLGKRRVMDFAANSSLSRQKRKIGDPLTAGLIVAALFAHTEGER